MHDWDSRHLDGVTVEDIVVKEQRSSYHICFVKRYSVRDILELSDDIGIAIEEHAWEHRPDEMPDGVELEVRPTSTGVEVLFVRARA